MVLYDPNANFSACCAVGGFCTVNRLCSSTQFSINEEDLQTQRGLQHLIAAITPLVKAQSNFPQIFSSSLVDVVKVTRNLFSRQLSTRMDGLPQTQINEPIKAYNSSLAAPTFRIAGSPISH